MSGFCVCGGPIRIGTAYTPPPGLVDWPSHLVAAGVDGDGVPDLAVGGCRIAVMYGTRGSAKATFEAIGSTAVTRMITADFDGDGHADLAFATEDGVSSSFPAVEPSQSHVRSATRRESLPPET